MSCYDGEILKRMKFSTEMIGLRLQKLNFKLKNITEILLYCVVIKMVILVAKLIMYFGFHKFIFQEFESHMTFSHLMRILARDFRALHMNSKIRNT
jgi:hypothetical protein